MSETFDAIKSLDGMCSAGRDQVIIMIVFNSKTAANKSHLFSVLFSVLSTGIAYFDLVPCGSASNILINFCYSGFMCNYSS